MDYITFTSFVGMSIDRMYAFQAWLCDIYDPEERNWDVVQTCTIDTYTTWPYAYQCFLADTGTEY